MEEQRGPWPADRGADARRCGEEESWIFYLREWGVAALRPPAGFRKRGREQNSNYSLTSPAPRTPPLRHPPAFSLKLGLTKIRTYC